MNAIDRGLIAMRISYNTRNEAVLRVMLRDLVRYGCSADEIYGNCTSLEMKFRIKALLDQMELRPVAVR